MSEAHAVYLQHCRAGENTLDQLHAHESVCAAQRIVADFCDLRESIKVSAEGFAVLDFVQGHVATDLPCTTARDIVDVIQGPRQHRGGTLLRELELLWLENYRRAYSLMIMRVLEDGVDRS